MNYKYCIFFSLSTFFIAHSMDKNIQHIEDLSTIISFDSNEQSIFELFRDKRLQDFGETPIYNCTTADGFFFKEISKIKNIDKPTLIQIAAGQSIYCKNIITNFLYKDQRQVIVCCSDKNSADMNNELVKKIVNELKLYYLLALYAQDHEKKEQNQNPQYQQIL